MKTKTFRKGQKLELRTRHQSSRGFAPVTVIGEVVEGNTKAQYKMKVRVYGDWRPAKGYQHEILRVTDDIWLVRIGIRINADRTTNLPEVLEIVRGLTDAEFKEQRAALTTV